MENIIYYKYNAWSVRDAIVFPVFSVFVWAGENDSNTLRVDAYFSWKRGGKNLVLKNIRIPVDGAGVSDQQDLKWTFLGGRNTTMKNKLH